MKYSVNLESPFAFSSYWYAIGILLLALGIVLFFLRGFIFSLSDSKHFSKLRKKLFHMQRSKYLRRIQGIEAAYTHGHLDTRGVCQQMSVEVRRFVQAVTGVRTDKMVYLELVKLNMPELAELVRQYYEPEFASHSEADARAAIQRGKELVEKWV